LAYGYTAVGIYRNGAAEGDPPEWQRIADAALGAHSFAEAESLADELSLSFRSIAACSLKAFKFAIYAPPKDLILICTTAYAGYSRSVDLRRRLLGQMAEAQIRQHAHSLGPEVVETIVNAHRQAIQLLEQTCEALKVKDEKVISDRDRELVGKTRRACLGLVAALIVESRAPQADQEWLDALRTRAINVADSVIVPELDDLIAFHGLQLERQREPKLAPAQTSQSATGSVARRQAPERAVATQLAALAVEASASQAPEPSTLGDTNKSARQAIKRAVQLTSKPHDHLLNALAASTRTARLVSVANTMFMHKQAITDIVDTVKILRNAKDALNNFLTPQNCEQATEADEASAKLQEKINQLMEGARQYRSPNKVALMKDHPRPSSADWQELLNKDEIEAVDQLRKLSMADGSALFELRILPKGGFKPVWLHLHATDRRMELNEVLSADFHSFSASHLKADHQRTLGTDLGQPVHRSPVNAAFLKALFEKAGSSMASTSASRGRLLP
jgi:hypothetical protein